ncbi:hypothetical protein BGZ94_004351 [Podila epigama]|nr:hypothetical protein BGZ94_004351 [Podila epigama]
MTGSQAAKLEEPVEIPQASTGTGLMSLLARGPADPPQEHLNQALNRRPKTSTSDSEHLADTDKWFEITGFNSYFDIAKAFFKRAGLERHAPGITSDSSDKKEGRSKAHNGEGQDQKDEKTKA